MRKVSAYLALYQNHCKLSTKMDEMAFGINLFFLLDSLICLWNLLRSI